MSKKELIKRFNDEWKKENQTKYVAWLIFYMGSIVPIIVAITQIVGGLNDDKVATIGICFVIWLVMEIIALVINIDKNKNMRKYLKDHQSEID